MEDKSGLRMYFFVMYNLSGIQKGIQAGHAALEYAYEHGKTPEYKDFIQNHKTFILLDGGGSEDMKERRRDLIDMGIEQVPFYEPDLNLSMSAIAFILPESIYGYEVFDPADLGYDFETHQKYEYFRRFRLASN